MKFSRIVSALLVLAMLGTTTAFAAEVDTAPNYEQSVANEEETSTTLEEIIAAADEEVRKLETVTDGQSDIDHEMITAISQQVQAEHANKTRVDYSIQYATLDLASTFSAADGLSSTKIASIYADGITAYTEADGNDAYRHFTWNFRSALSVGSSYARIYTINYEWANVLLDTYDDYCLERYDYYYDLYYWSVVTGTITTDTLLNMAIADADDYIVELRDSMKTTCKASKSNFSAVFGNDSVMDFWNNYYGRSYASSYSSLTPAEAYNKAVSNGVIISSRNNVTSSNITTVYNSNWWYTGS